MRQEELTVKKSRSGLLRDDTNLCPLNKPTAAICTKSTNETLPSGSDTGSVCLACFCDRYTPQ